MTKLNFDEKFEIYLFTDHNLEENTSKLNEFLSFLKYSKVQLPYKFSYVSRKADLIPDLCLNDNILMDFSPDSLTASREFQFQDFLKERPNRDLEKLYLKIGSPYELPANSDSQMKKISSLIKSLIFEGQFIFLEEPELDLDEECKELFINALKDHIKRNSLNVFIFSKNREFWLPHTQQLVKREKNYSFTIEKVSDKYEWQKDRNKFYAPMKIDKTIDQTLQFYFPKTTATKKDAA